VISGLRRGVNEIFALLWRYSALICSYRRFGTAYPSHLHGQEAQDSSRTASHLKKTGPIGSPGTSITHLKWTLCNIREDRRRRSKFDDDNSDTWITSHSYYS